MVLAVLFSPTDGSVWCCVEARRFSCAEGELVLFGGERFGGDCIFSWLAELVLCRVSETYYPWRVDELADGG